MEHPVKCHICGNVFPVASVAQLHCRDLKDWEEDGDRVYLVNVDGELQRVYI